MNIYCFSTLSFAKLQFKSVINKAFHKHGVASFTDAWIETWMKLKKWQQCFVASFTDAWIETLFYCQYGSQSLSHLLQMRGLKLKNGKQKTIRMGSHLLQMRGLKPKAPATPVAGGSRIFYRCVDWNHAFGRRTMMKNVASFTDAWIETTEIRRESIVNAVASFTDAWIET